MSIWIVTGFKSQWDMTYAMMILVLKTNEQSYKL